jgi:DNA-binding transcriptional LysR family regulator
MLAERLSLKITTDHSLDLYRMIEDRAVDVAFVVNQVMSSSFRATPIFREKMKILKTVPEGRQIDTNAINVSDLNPRYEIFLNWSLSYQIWHDHVWQKGRGPHFETDSVRHIASFLAEHERYWIIVPQSVADYFSGSDGLQAFDVYPEPPARICYELVHKSPNPSVITAIEIFDAELSRWLTTKKWITPCRTVATARR